MNYAGTTDFSIVIDGVKRASKTFSETGHYIEIPAILNEDGSVNETATEKNLDGEYFNCLLYTSPSPRDVEESRMPSSA